MMRRTAIVLPIAGVLLAAIAWRLHAPRTTLPAIDAAPATVPVARELAPLPPAKTPAAAKAAVSQFVHPAAGQPLALAYPALLLLARGGDVDAMFDLGTRLKRCEDFNPRAARQFVGLNQEELEKLDRESAPDAAARSRAAALRDDIEMRVRTIADCESVPENERRSIVWIEAAALAGRHEARRIYLLDGLDEFGLGAPDYIVNIDEVIRRRDVARRLAREDVDACVPGAFGARLTAMDRTLGVLHPRQRLEAAQAALLEADDDEQRGIARTFAAEAAAGLDVAAREQARRAGEDAWGRCAGRR